jgi:F0F1-type ATP synthase beta subunit
LQKVHPVKAQTGPAMRDDKLVMKKHLDLIKNNKQLTQVYKTLSDLISTQQHLK